MQLAIKRLHIVLLEQIFVIVYFGCLAILASINMLSVDLCYLSSTLFVNLTIYYGHIIEGFHCIHIKFMCRHFI